MGDMIAAPAEAIGYGSTRVDRVISWLKARESKILVAGVCLQVLVLAGMIALQSVPLIFGKSVLLRVVPVDPRDFFRGDYVILSYEFNSMPAGKIEGLSVDNRGEWKGRKVYVTLEKEPDGKHWRAERVSIQPPVGGTYLRGHIADYGQLLFGIEAYYVQEGKGKQYEEAIRRKKLSAEIAVTSSGRAALRALRIE
jgi:uncharacterized membrane-anchored protein